MQAKFAVPLACLLLSPFAVRADDVSEADLAAFEIEFADDAR